ncbi:MAG: heme lyase CcmF/NrfE family subunit [Paracoccaceae bacterium]
MIAEIGHFSLILAFVVAIVQMIVPLIGAQKGWIAWMEVAVPAAWSQFLLTLLAFGALTHAFATSDFSLRLVAANSHSLKPMLYKLTGTWGNHEGSMLLWVFILTLFGAILAAFGQNLPSRLKALVLAVQSSIAVAFFAFILFTSNPFSRLAHPPGDGNGLNPLLQDAGLAFHPPFLYLGYVGLSMAFSFAVAALIEGRVDAAWARWVRPWTLAAWVLLTAGIVLGSWWAYYELGWGGWWFWDPVENASFMPWLVAAALLHSAIVVEKRESLKTWTILLAILAFSFSLIGTFIVRSGVITSVHAFANDPERGVFILIILALTIGGSLSLFALRAPNLTSRGVFALVSRESGLVLNNILLIVAAFVVFVGTVWPLVAELAFGRKLSVGAPFFNLAFTPFIIALILILPIGAVLPWKRAGLGKAASALQGTMVLALALGALVYVLETGIRMMAPIGLALAAWLMFGALRDLGLRVRAGSSPARESLRRLRTLPRGDYGKLLGHFGLGVVVFGIAAITAWEAEEIRVVQEGESFTLAGPVSSFDIRFDGVKAIEGPNYSAIQGAFSVLSGGREVARLHPEKRSYQATRMPTTEAAIDIGFWRDVYVVIGDAQDGGGYAVRAYIKPFANWIWGGAILMALGGLASLTDRRYRVAAGARRRTPDAVLAE